MGSGKQRQDGGARNPGNDDQYRPALTYVELDRAHRKRSRWATVLAVSVLVLVASLAMLGVIGYSYLQGQAKNDRIAEHADLAAVESSFEEGATRIDWDALRAVNPDTVGWLYIPGTTVNYPVVQGEDNDYYLSHDFERDQGWLAQFGAIFLDWRNDPNWSDQANFIYGHHMNDGSMFASIAGLADQERFDESRTVYLLSPRGSFRLKTFALIHCASDDPIVQVSFPTSKDMASYVQDKMDRSIVRVEGAPPANDVSKLFAFATCDNYSSGRYVLYAYVEQQAGVSTSSAASAGGASGAIGWVDDLPADEPAGMTSAAGAGGAVQEPDPAGGDLPAAEPHGGDGEAVGDDGRYAGGYYAYDDDGELIWVPTDDES